MTDALAAIAIGYLLGSLPFGYWAGRLRGIDLRLAGSGNTGATNVMRVLGLKVGVPVMALDIAKGAAAVVVARELSSNDIVPVLAAAAAVTGHMYPFLLGFRGGKGVATAVGAFLVLAPLATLVCAGVFVAVVAATRYVSLGSMLAMVLLPPVAGSLFHASLPVVAAAAATAVLVVLKHRENLKRLVRGTERRLGQK